MKRTKQRHTEQDYYEMIDERLNGSDDYQWQFYPIDLIAGEDEWAAFKAALLRWLGEQEREHLEGFAQYKAEQAEERKHRPLRSVPDGSGT